VVGTVNLNYAMCELFQNLTCVLCVNLCVSVYIVADILSLDASVPVPVSTPVLMRLGNLTFVYSEQVGRMLYVRLCCMCTHGKLYVMATSICFFVCLSLEMCICRAWVQ